MHNENKRNQFQEKLNCVRKAWALVKERLKDHGNFFNLAKSFFWTMDYSPMGGQKIESADVKCMQINFAGHGLFSFRDFARFSFAFKMAKFPFQTMDYNYSPWGSNN